MQLFDINPVIRVHVTTWYNKFESLSVNVHVPKLPTFRPDTTYLGANNILKNVCFHHSELKQLGKMTNCHFF